MEEHSIRRDIFPITVHEVAHNGVTQPRAVDSQLMSSTSNEFQHDFGNGFVVVVASG